MQKIGYEIVPEPEKDLKLKGIKKLRLP